MKFLLFITQDRLSYVDGVNTGLFIALWKEGMPFELALLGVIACSAISGVLTGVVRRKAGLDP